MEMTSQATHVILRKDVVQSDPKLALPRPINNGRKHLVKELWPRSEKPIQDPEWFFGPPYTGSELSAEGKTPVLETGSGGTEIATFDQRADQDRHLHRISTETYIVLDGVLRMSINDGAPVTLLRGDEIIVLPRTIHQIMVGDCDTFLARLHAMQCHGDVDKYVQLTQGGDWQPWKSLTPEERKNALRL
jgi:quercetin dioxygenase-like cupin family protein